MLETIETNRMSIAALCRKHGVRRLDLFGSAAREDFDAARSDIDFLVEFLSYADPMIADHWFGLQEDLAELLRREVDLTSMRTAVNPYFLAVANRSRVTLYAS
jgi:predicted nucleotidyltransferase